MKKLAIAISVLFVVGSIYYFLPTLQKEVEKQSKKSDESGKVFFQFAKLPDGMVARSGKYTLTQKEVEHSAAMDAFRNRKRDVLFLLVYKQFVSFNDAEVGKLEFSFKKVSRSPSSLLNQYGLPIKNKTAIEFSAFPSEEGVAKLDGRVITEEELDKNNFIWGSYASEIFQFKLREIDKKIKTKILIAEARGQNITLQSYKQKYIYDKLPIKITDKDITSYMQKYNMGDSIRNRKSAENRLLELRRRRGEDYILEKYIMDLPVYVNLPAPHFTLESKDKFTPLYKKGKGQILFNFFGDTRSKSSVRILEGLFHILDKYENLELAYRPIYFANDRMQELTSLVHFCVWMENKDMFWKFLRETLGDLGGKTEEVLYLTAKKIGVSKDKLKSCIKDNKSKELVDYHMKYANYVGIFAGPVLYIDGEVLHGNISKESIEKILQRKLELPVAGVW